MKNIDWKTVLKLIAAIIAAILSTIGATSCWQNF